MNELKIEKLSKEYIDSVYNIEKNLIGDCDKEVIAKSLYNENLNYYILIKQGEVIGFFECLILPPEVELYDIAVVKDEQGKGYSNVMMDYLINLAKESKSNTILLEVNSINSKAIKLYNKYGFKKYSERKRYYGDNDAILMKLEISLD